jgi:hypothetical protein
VVVVLLLLLLDIYEWDNKRSRKKKVEGNIYLVY